MSSTRVVKLRAGKYLKQATLGYDRPEVITVRFSFSRPLINEIRVMDGARWVPEETMWTVKDSERNKFQLAYLEGQDPYAPWDKGWQTDFSDGVDGLVFERTLYDHQKEMISFAISRNYCIFACEMGTGKTLAAIEVAERCLEPTVDALWYVGPKSGIYAVEREFEKWGSLVYPNKFLTFEALTTFLKTYDGPAPRMAIIDESSKIKNPASQRSQAVMHLANSIRKEYGQSGYVIEMSGTPAPRMPTDWWHQCEVACPGFLREGNIHKFKNQLCITEKADNEVAGVTYNKIVTWKDDPVKCSECGLMPDEHGGLGHTYKKSVNEVHRLYSRMKGLVLVKLKKDCLDLPEKIFEVINIKPDVEVLRAARIITAKATRAVQALTLLRELSDGFQYTDIEDGEETCANCIGSGNYMAPVSADDAKMVEVICDLCGGKGSTKKYRRETLETISGKDQVFIDQLNLHDEVGRFIVWGGFTGTIDRLIKMAHQQGWTTLRFDGTVAGEDVYGNPVEVKELLDAMDFSHPNFQNLLEKYPRVCFVGHPQAGGMALTLTGSPTALYYSNSFSGEGYMQSLDRHHRAGMDMNRCCKVIDIFYLPIDKYVLDNLRQKRDLQRMTMGEINTAMEGEVS